MTISFGGKAIAPCLLIGLAATSASPAAIAAGDVPAGKETSLDTVTVRADRQAQVADTKKETKSGSRATLTKEQLDKFVGLSSAVTGALAYVPGVHFGGGDASGIAEGNFSIRGFSKDQIGFTRDGVPVNDPLYLTPHADFMGDPENYGSVSVLYGSAAIDAPTLTASGGSVEIRTVAPTPERDFLFKQGFGSDSLRRTYFRANSGEYNGFSGWLSASHTEGNLWTDGAGEQRATRFEGNLQYRWGNGNRINGIFSLFDMKTNNYLNPTLAQFNAQPYGTGYPDVAFPTAGPAYGAGAGLPGGGASAKLQRADFSIQTYALNGLFNLGDSVRLRVDPYYVRVADGAASVAAVLLPNALLSPAVSGGATSGSRPVALEIFPSQYRLGTTTRLDFTVSDTNSLQLGSWFDYTHANNQQPAVAIGADGAPVSTNGGGIVAGVNGRPLYFTNQQDRISTQKVWLQDTWNFSPNWLLTAGVAYQHTLLQGTNVAGLLSGNASGNAAHYNRVLPSASLSYQLDARNQLYASVASNIRTPAVSSVFSSTATSPQTAETTLNHEIGWRFSTADLLVNTALFYDRFRNRQVSYSPVTGVTSYFNAGSVTTEGAELSFAGRLPHHFNYFGSWTYVRATQDDDYSANGLTANTRGRQLYNTPRNVASLGVGYDDSHFYANVVARYTGSYFGDLANTERIGSATVVDLNLGYRFKPPGVFIKSAVLSLNVNNLFNRHYLSSVNSGTVSAAQGSAFYAAPTYWLAQPVNVFANLALNF
ncbi:MULTISPECIES: TonB-dependent receptor domain-containing protein [Burkholderia]|uniref:TonB-dependent siderophore receptor n=2 Tax=Burkholderia TaxID=32008 RepID=A0A6J5IPA6_9BURK|nr:MULTISPECIES: TonB-dependent receptor [Burkholderia]CAB3961497.1 TonB-dependent siderophore receptor [Burkholderia aenigmatica]